MGFPENLSYWRKRRKLTQAALGKMMGGITGSHISQLESGSRLASGKTIEKIAKALFITPGMLMDGVGGFGFVSAESIGEALMKENSHLSEPLAQTEIITISFLPDTEHCLPFRETWFQEQFGKEYSQFALVRVSDDMMEPTLTTKDIVMVDMSSRDVSIAGIYVFQKDDKFYVNRTECALGKIRIVPDNKKYSQFDYDPDVPVVGEVVWRSGVLK